MSAQTLTPPPAGTPPPVDTRDQNMWAMLSHLSALAGVIIPFGNIIGPLIIWMMKKDQYPAVNEHGKESLNFQISITIYLVVSAILIILLIGIVLMVVIGIFAVVMVIINAIKANDGQSVRYPITIRFIK